MVPTLGLVSLPLRYSFTLSSDNTLQEQMIMLLYEVTINLNNLIIDKD